MNEMQDISSKFIHTTEDENGVLQKISFLNDDTFNFSFDIVDEMAKKDPNKLAMLHVSKDGKERRITFRRCV